MCHCCDFCVLELLLHACLAFLTRSLTGRCHRCYFNSHRFLDIGTWLALSAIFPSSNRAHSCCRASCCGKVWRAWQHLCEKHAGVSVEPIPGHFCCELLARRGCTRCHFLGARECAEVDGDGDRIQQCTAACSEPSRCHHEAEDRELRRMSETRTLHAGMHSINERQASCPTKLRKHGCSTGFV